MFVWRSEYRRVCLVCSVYAQAERSAKPTLASLYEATAWRSFDVLKTSKPAATARSMKYGSVKLRSIKVLKGPSDSPSRRSWPLPSKLRSRVEMSPKGPDVVH